MNIIYGNHNTGKTHELWKEIANHLKSGGTAFVFSRNNNYAIF
jgi:hypothetical protein